MLCFEIAERKQLGIRVDKLLIDSEIRMAIRLDNEGTRVGRAVYLEREWGKKCAEFSEKYPRDIYGAPRVKRAMFSEDGSELLLEPKGGKARDWNCALVRILTGAGPGVHVRFECARDAEVIYNGNLEKLVILKPGTGFKLTRFGAIEPDQRRHIAYFWDWDTRLRPILFANANREE